MSTIKNIEYHKHPFHRRCATMILVLLICECMTVYASKHALLIGISQYPQYKEADDSWQPIHGANDVALLSPTLRKQGFHVTSLTNAHATADAIRKSLSALCSRVQKNDIVYIHFSCHGQPYEDLNGDEEDGWDETIVPFDARRRFSEHYDGHNHILDDELELIINKIRRRAGHAGCIYVIVDACHSGGASRDEKPTDDELFIRGTDCGFSPMGKKFIPKINRHSHFKVRQDTTLAKVCYIESCRSYQTNAEIKENGMFYGPLSFYINKTLKSWTLNDDTRWITRVVKFMSTDKRLIRQNPVIETDR